MMLKTQKPLRGGFVWSSQQTMEGAPFTMKPVTRDPSLDMRTPFVGGAYAPYESTDPTASKIQPGAGVQSYYENAAKAPLRL